MFVRGLRSGTLRWPCGFFSLNETPSLLLPFCFSYIYSLASEMMMHHSHPDLLISFYGMVFSTINKTCRLNLGYGCDFGLVCLVVPKYNEASDISMNGCL